MIYKRYKMLQKYINGEPQEEYKQGELIDDTIYQTLDACNEGNQNPDKPIEGYIYQWVTVSGEYVCNDVNKYTKEKEQKSSNNGVTWTDTGRTRQGTLIEVNSADCGYVPPTPGGYENQYLTFESLDDNNKIYLSTGYYHTLTVYISLDNGITWTEKKARNMDALVTLNRGEKMLIKGNNAAYASSASAYSHFQVTKPYNVSGNIMSLVYGDNFIGQTQLNTSYTFARLFAGYIKYEDRRGTLISAENLILPATSSYSYYNLFDNESHLTTPPKLTATTLANGCYQYMFSGCTSLTTAPELPATTLVSNCYRSMFDVCTSLATAPELPATTLANYCYYQMFYGCTALTTAPSVLPATTLAAYCYYNMFDGCTSLTTAPELPAETLVDYCYAGMFYNCASLNYIKAMFTTRPTSTYTKNWVSGVASSGTFVKNSSATWNVTGVNGIPEGWTVING